MGLPDDCQFRAAVGRERCDTELVSPAGTVDWAGRQFDPVGPVGPDACPLGRRRDGRHHLVVAVVVEVGHQRRQPLEHRRRVERSVRLDPSACGVDQEQSAALDGVAQRAVGVAGRPPAVERVPVAVDPDRTDVRRGPRVESRLHPIPPDDHVAVRGHVQQPAVDGHRVRVCGAVRRRTDETEGYARRLTERRLYKRAVWAEHGAVPDDLLAMDHDSIHERERTIATEASVDPDAVLLDVPGEPTMTESSSRVVVNGEVRQLGAQSTLVSALRAAQHDQWRLGVYAPQAVSDRVGEAAIRVLGLELDGSLVRDVRPGIHATLDEFN